jgi:hypothetical protein
MTKFSMNSLDSPNLVEMRKPRDFVSQTAVSDESMIQWMEPGGVVIEPNFIESTQFAVKIRNKISKVAFTNIIWRFVIPIIFLV